MPILYYIINVLQISIQPWIEFSNKTAKSGGIFKKKTFKFSLSVLGLIKNPIFEYSNHQKLFSIFAKRTNSNLIKS